jgi:hypothetical protein
MRKIIYSQDGNQRCAVFEDFDCLQTSPAGFGNTDEEAKSDLIRTAINEGEIYDCPIHGLQDGTDCPRC